MCTSPAIAMPSEEAFGDAAFMFWLGNPQGVDWKMEGIEIQYKKRQNGDTPSWVQHQIITIFRAKKMHGLIVTITNLVDELVPFFFDAYPAGILEDIYIYLYIYIP